MLMNTLEYIKEQQLKHRTITPESLGRVFTDIEKTILTEVYNKVSKCKIKELNNVK